MSRVVKQEACITVCDDGTLTHIAYQNGGGQLKLYSVKILDWDSLEKLLGHNADQPIKNAVASS